MGWDYKKVLVIGATSGIGQALAEKFVEAGSFVIVSGRRRDRLDAFVQKHGHDKAEALEFDVCKLDTIANVISNVTQHHEDLDCVFVNSGIQRSADFSHPDQVNMELINQELTVNYLAPLHITKQILPFLKSKNTPSAIMYTTSGLALTPAVRCPNYCAAKAAMHHFALCLREQLQHTSIKVVEIIPPAVQTELHNEINQPDLGKSFGMPLEEFTHEAFSGLAQGKDQIPVGVAQRSFGGWELARQKAFAGMIGQMGGQPSKSLKAFVEAG